jgi:4-aminobutyrate aminotransferase-like enzyme
MKNQLKKENTQTKFLKKEEIENLILSRASDEEIKKCKDNHLLVPVFDRIIEGAFEPGSPYFKIKDDDRKIIDCTSQAWVLSLGHAPPDPAYAAYIQSQVMNHHQYGFLDDTRVKLINKLVDILPGQLKGGKIAINNMGGGASNEAAIRLAYVSQKGTQKQQILVFTGGYHGSSLALTGASQLIRIATRYRPFGLDRWEKFSFPYCYRCPWNHQEGFYGLRDKNCSLECVSQLRNFLDFDVKSDVAAALIEPMQGAGGQIPAPVEFLRGLKKIGKDSRIQIIYDEFQTGFGRTGHMFATDYYNADGGEDISPDMMTFAKGAAAGFPIGFTAASSKYKQLSEAEEHSTFSSSPVAMAASLVTLEIMLKHKIPENARKMGALITKRLKEMQEKYIQIGDIRGPGLFIGVELVKDQKTRERFTKLFDAMKEEGWKQAIYFQGMMPFVDQEGAITRNIIKIKPPLIINEEDANIICDRFELCLKNSLQNLSEKK